MSNELEDLIKSSVPFHKVTATGFHTMKCPVCGDSKVRAGFKFEPNKVVYNCFKGKCSASCEYEYGGYISDRFKNLMEVLGVDIPIELKFTKKKHKAFEELDNDLYEKHFYKEVELPDHRLYDPDKDWYYRQELEKRGVEFKHDLYIGRKDEWKNKLIIPFYFNNTLIGWQAMYMAYGHTKYLTGSGNSDIMYVNTEHGYLPKEPVVCEGVMDALSIPNGVAILSNKVSRKQAYHLRNKKPILLPDRKASKFITNAKQYKWRISIPEWKEKDSNDALQVHGKYTVAKMLHDGIQSNLLQAEVRYNLWKTN